MKHHLDSGKSPRFRTSHPFHLSLQLILATFIFAAPSTAASADNPTVRTSAIHSDRIESIAFAPNGKWLVTASGDGVAKIWDKATGRLLRDLVTGADCEAVGVTHASDRVVLRVRGREGGSGLQIWDALLGKKVHEVRFESEEGNIFPQFVIQKQDVILTQVTRGLRRWDAQTGRNLGLLDNFVLGVTEFDNVGRAIALSPDERLIVVGTTRSLRRRASIRVLDASTGQYIRQMVSHTDDINAVAFSPDGSRIVSGSDDKTVKLWDVSGSLLRTFSGHRGDVRSVSFFPDGAHVMSADNDEIRIWNVDGALVRTIPTKYSLGRAAISGDGRFIATVREINDIQLLDAQTGEPVWPSHGGLDTVSVLPAPEEKVLLNKKGKQAIWDPASGRIVHDDVAPFYSGTQVARSEADNRWLASEEVIPGTFALRDLKTGQRTAAFEAVPATAVSRSSFRLVVSPNGRWVAAAVDIHKPDEQKNLVRLWDVQAGRESNVFNEIGTNFTTFIAASPDGRILAYNTKDGGWYEQKRKKRPAIVRLYDTVTAKALPSIDCGKIDCEDLDRFDISPDNRLLFIAAQSTLRPGFKWSDVDDFRVVDIVTGRKLWSARHNTEAIYGSISAGRFSPDGRWLVTASRRGNSLKMWDAQRGRLIREFPANPGTTESILFNETATRLIVGNRNGSTGVYDTNTGELLATSFYSNDGQWVTITPEGFFVASENGAKILYTVRGFETFGIDQVYQSLHRPDLIREKLAGDPDGKVREAATRIDLTKVVASGSAPRVGIAASASGTRVQGDQAAVEAEITDQGGGIGKVEWRVNGVTLGVEERGIRRTDGQGDSARTIKVSRTLGLTPGENRIAVLAYNAAGLIASEPAEIVIDSVQQGATRPRLYVLGVGVNDYWDSALKLSYAAPDARRIADGLKQAGDKLYEQVEVKIVLDAEATAEKLDGVFAELGKKVRPQDVFVFFLAGHGKTVDARFYFLPQDFRYAGEDSIVKKGVGQNQLQEWVSRIKAQKSVLLFDACESGSLVGDRIAMRGIEEKTAIDRMTRAMGRTVLTATTDSKPAIEGYRGHGVFTYTLLAGFDAADANADGVVDVTELATYVDRRLPDLTYDAFKLRQVPQMSIVGSNFPLASKVSLLPADGASPAASALASAIPAKPTHVVIAPADVFEQLAGKGGKLEQLSPGTLVSLVKTDQGWVLVARGGKQIGYVAEDRLMRVQ